MTRPDELEVGRAIASLCETAAHLAPGEVSALVRIVCEIVGATDGRLLVADYGLLRLQQVDSAGPVGDPQFIEGTLAGRAFANGEPVLSGSAPTLLWVPLTHGTERIGVLELEFDERDGALPDVVKPVIAVFVMLLITQSRYSDLWVRARRSEPLSAAAEAQWDLLPPLACSTNEVALAGILEPAYEIGGDSFDYALNGCRLDFAIVDAVGHGMSSVLMSAAAINSVRNTRREGGDLTAAYQQADQLIRDHFGDCYYVTAQLATLDLPTGSLRWINAGHVAPLLVRNGTYAGELVCAPSMPIGLGGSVVEVATQKLQTGDRVLFYTDGITESRSADASRFGTEHLADLLARSTHDDVPVAETVRRLSASVVAHFDNALNDDATLLLIEYRG